MGIPRNICLKNYPARSSLKKPIREQMWRGLLET